MVEICGSLALPVRQTNLKHYYSSLKKLFEEVIAEHKESIDYDAQPRDFVDAYLHGIQETPQLLSEQDLVGICFDFFEAGGETTGSTLSWFLMYFALYPDIQEKCYQEVMSVLGDRLPTAEDRKQLPYLDATIKEFQRVSNVVPAGLDHYFRETCNIEGYTIPKGTSVFTIFISSTMTRTSGATRRFAARSASCLQTKRVLYTRSI